MATGNLGSGIREERGAGRGQQTYLQAFEQDLGRGMDYGRRLFYDDPDMQQMRQTRQDLAKGYSGAELGAMRGAARQEIQGQRQSYLGQLQSNLARRGVGGARAAAMRGAADQGFTRTQADTERKMLLDSAQMRRQGASDLQDFLFRQRYGQLGTGGLYGQLGVAERAADAMRASQSGGRQPGFFGQLLDNLF